MEYLYIFLNIKVNLYGIIVYFSTVLFEPLYHPKSFPKSFSFPFFFPDFSSSKSEFTRLFRDFLGFSRVFRRKRGCYKGTNNTVNKQKKKTYFLFEILLYIIYLYIVLYFFNKIF